MSKKFNTVPSLRIRNREGLLSFLRENDRANLKHPDCYDIRSDYVVETMHRIALENGGPWKTVFNAQAKKALTLDLFGIELDNEMAHQEGDVLSMLIYNGQEFRRADMLHELGFTLGSEEILKQALDQKMLIETASGRIGKPREIKGSIYAMVPKSRTKHYTIIGQPVRLVTQSQASAIEAARKAAMNPDGEGTMTISLDLHTPLDLSTLVA